MLQDNVTPEYCSISLDCNWSASPRLLEDQATCSTYAQDNSSACSHLEAKSYGDGATNPDSSSKGNHRRR